MIAEIGPYSPRLLSGDYEQRRRRWLKPVRRMPWYLLVWNEKGEESITVEGTNYRVPPGTVYLIPPGCRCELSSEQGNRLVWIHFAVVPLPPGKGYPGTDCSPDEWPVLAPLAQPSPVETWGIDLPLFLPEELVMEFARTLPRIIQLDQTHRLPQVIEARHLLSGLLLHWVQWTWVSQRPGTHQSGLSERIERAEKVARERLGQGFGVTELAAAAGLSRSRFSVLYREHRGQTPGIFLRDLRIRQAERLLRESNWGVTDIAALVGYADPSVFIRVFCRYHGQTPTVWRQSRQLPMAKNQPFHS